MSLFSQRLKEKIAACTDLSILTYSCSILLRINSFQTAASTIAIQMSLNGKVKMSQSKSHQQRTTLGAQEKNCPLKSQISTNSRALTQEYLQKK